MGVGSGLGFRGIGPYRPGRCGMGRPSWAKGSSGGSLFTFFWLVSFSVFVFSFPFIYSFLLYLNTFFI